MEFTYVFVFVCVILAGLVGGLSIWLFSRRKRLGELSEPVGKPVVQPPGTDQAIEILRMPRAETALKRTREALSGALQSFWGGKANLTAAQWEQIEEALLSADVGVATSQKFLGLLKERVAATNQGASEFRTEDLVRIGKDLLGPLSHGAPAEHSQRPTVISIVGVNGVGKTTTVGKLAHWYRSQGKKVLVGAADTFRAAAMEQLRVWADRTGAEFVGGREQGDPGAVVFDALTAGKARGMDVVLIDTAGRLHTKQNLMEELSRVHRVMQKVIPDAPHEVWLVLDGNLGQNSVRQAKEFASILKLSGVIVTKLDGSAKGGALFAIASELGLAIRFLGLGEKAEDLVPFEPERFVQALVSPAVA
jgi:fused signal recognition particle receptor